MERMLGILNDFDLKIEKMIGVLLYREFPSTIVFVDSEKNPIIKEWVDCSDDGKIDRYYFFKTSRFHLKEYISGNLAHIGLIESACDGFLYFEDVTGKVTSNKTIISTRQLPFIYKPENDYYFEREEGVNTEEIEEYFNLKKVSDDETLISHIKDIANEKRAETYNLHILKGTGVGYGTINTEVLGKTLVKFEKFYKDIAHDYYLGKNRGELKLDKQAKDEIEVNSATEVYGNLAASYIVLIKPKAIQYEMFENKTDTEKIANLVFGLINSSANIEKIKEYYFQFSDFVINSYKEFLKEIYEDELNINLGWYSPNNKVEYKEDINFSKANRIISTIESLSFERKEEFAVRGKFRSINCDTRHFTFYSIKNEAFAGYFDKSIKDSTQITNFIDLFELKITRTILKEPGKKDATTNDIITSIYLIKD